MQAYAYVNGIGTELAAGKETRDVKGKGYVYEEALVGDSAIIKTHTSDPYGNPGFCLASGSFNPIMAMTARTTGVEVDHIVSAGHPGTDDMHTPGLFVDRIVKVSR